jgi:hypothetical protein
MPRTHSRDPSSNYLNQGLFFGSRHYKGVTPSLRPPTWPRG